jgi:hypothetical protein
MTVYLWHMLVLVLMAGTLLLVGAELPGPLSAPWWDSRPVWLLCAIGLVALVTAAAARWETGPSPKDARGRAVGRAAASAAAAFAIGGVVVILATGLSVAGGVIGLACLGAGLWLAGGGRVSGWGRLAGGSRVWVPFDSLRSLRGL